MQQMKETLQLSEVETPDRQSTQFRTTAASALLRNNIITDSTGKEWNYLFTSTGNFSLTYNTNIEFLFDYFERTVEDESGESKKVSAWFFADQNNTVNMRELTDYSGVIYNYEYGVHPVTYFRNGVEVTEPYDFSRYNQPYREILDPITDDNPDGLNITKEFGYEPKHNQMVRIVDPRI